jgi:hypothetical protein
MHLATLLVVTTPLLPAANAAALYERAAFEADLPPGAHSATCVATVIDERTIQIEHFTYDGGGPAVYFYLGATQSDPSFEDGLQLMPLLTGTVFSDDTLTLTLPAGHTLDGYTAISVWCADFAVSFTDATFVAPAADYPRAGWTATLPPGAHMSSGAVTIINERILHVEDFSYDGTAPLVYFYLGATNDDPEFASGVPTDPQLVDAYSNESLVATRPDGDTFDEFAATSLWCAAFDVNFTSGTFRPDVTADHNNNGVFDPADHDVLLACLAGPETPPTPATDSSFARCIGAFDFNEDAAIDLRDYATIQAATP